MLENLIWCAILSSGSIYCAARFQKRFETVLPITCMGMVLILFLFGIFGILAAGVWVIFLLAAAFYAAAGVHLVKTRTWREFLCSVITPGAVIFAVMFVVLNVCNYKHIPTGGDEFSHWAYIVKAMTYWDDFGTNPNAHALFASYPPGVALFQYFLQKLFALMNPQIGYIEWRIFLSYQVLFFSFMFPFLDRLSFRRPANILLACGVMFCAPLVVFGGIYSVISADPFIGIAFASGMAMVFRCEKKDIYYYLHVSFCCAMLTLIKDAGLLFSIFLGLTFIMEGVIENRGRGGSWKTNSPLLVVPLAAGLLAKILWKFEVTMSDVVVKFGNPYDVGVLWDVMLGRDTSYRTTVWDKFWPTILQSNALFGTSYIKVFLGLILVLYLLYCAYSKKEPEKRDRRKGFPDDAKV